MFIGFFLKRTSMLMDQSIKKLKQKEITRSHQKTGWQLRGCDELRI